MFGPVREYLAVAATGIVAAGLAAGGLGLGSLARPARETRRAAGRSSPPRPVSPGPGRAAVPVTRARFVWSVAVTLAVCALLPWSSSVDRQGALALVPAGMLLLAGVVALLTFGRRGG